MTGGCVVVLGDTGKNFGAGMSGGIAYVYDVQGSFSTVCNKEMVDLDPLDKDDISTLKLMIENHYLYTGSTSARFILDDFENQLKSFIKVFPKDYKKVLQSQQVKVAVQQ